MTSLYDSADTSPARPGRGRGLAAWIGRIEIWIVLSLAFTALMRIFHGDSPEATSLWFLDPALSLVFLALMRSSRRFGLPKNGQLTRKQATAAFIFTSWTVGMLTELTLSEGGGGYGGLHVKTIPSFILAQGYYIPLAVLGTWLVRRYHLTFYELFFVAGMTSLYEMITAGLPVLLSPFFLFSPIVIAYYFVIYSRLLSMGLLVVDENLIWDNFSRHISFRRKIGCGVLLGLACWLVFLAWGETVNYLFDDFESF